jgi:hypothetical protein
MIDLGFRRKAKFIEDATVIDKAKQSFYFEPIFNSGR